MRVESYSFETLQMIPFVVGTLENNLFLVADTLSKEAVIIDPTGNLDAVLHVADANGWKIKAALVTHPHFDHMFDAYQLQEMQPPVPLLMHPEAQTLYEQGGLAKMTNSNLKNLYRTPTYTLSDGAEINIGSYRCNALYTPGHCLGHNCYYFPQAAWCFSGDLIFWHDHGRTDLPGGSNTLILKSIREKILTLPENTIIFPGHNDFTTIADEKKFYA